MLTGTCRENVFDEDICIYDRFIHLFTFNTKVHYIDL